VSKFEFALDHCLELIENGQATLEGCLEIYPEFAEQLQPLLLAARKVQVLAKIHPTPNFRQKGRAQLLAHTQAKPQRAQQGLFLRLPQWNFATTLAILGLVVFSTTTAFAQYALPGNPLYGWKRVSEKVWRAVSPDLLYTDLALAERRIHEYIAADAQDRQRDEILLSYTETLNFISADIQGMPGQGQATRSKLEIHQDLLNQTGIQLGTLDELLELLISAAETPDAAPEVDAPDATVPPSNTPLPPENGSLPAATIVATVTRQPVPTEKAIDAALDAVNDNGMPPPGKGIPPGSSGSPELDEILQPIRDLINGILP
jgi:hypothetical protein